MEKTIQALLEKIGELQKRQTFKQIEVSKRGENFNVFNVLGLWSEEVRLHSAMLAELLNPDGSHGCSDAFLVAFVKEVLKKDEKLLDIINSLGKAIVTTEYNAGNISADGMKGGRIDILIEMPQESGVPSFIIENKIYADDQPNQLRRYYNSGIDCFHSSDDFIILYLTLYGSEASPSSIGKESPFSYIRLSYKDNIRKWLNQCAAIAYDKPKVRETIIQYNHLLTQITAYNMEDNNPLVEEIASNNDYLRNAILICSWQNEIIKKAILGPIEETLKKVQKAAEAKIIPYKVEFDPDKDFKEDKGRIDWGFRFFITYGNLKINLSFVFQTWGLKDLCYGISQEGTSLELLRKQPLFNNQNEFWPWGWEWMPDKYQSWNGENLYNLIRELTGNAVESSDFYKTIVDSIQKASQLFKTKI